MNGVPRLGMLAAVVLLTSGLLAGCGGDDDAAPQPTPSFSSSTASPTAASPSPSTSGSARMETPRAFVRRWNAALTDMQNSGDSTMFRAISENCDACATVANLVDKYHDAGGSIMTKGWHFTSVSCKSTVPTQSECVAKGHNPVTTVHESATSATTTLAAGPLSQYFRLSYSGTSWNMDYIAREAS